MTDAKPNIIEVLSNVMREIQAIGKNGHNKDQNYSFRGIDAVVNAVGPLFREYGVVPVPMVETLSHRDVTTSRGKPSRECTVKVTYRFYGPAGDHIDATVPGESMDTGDKGAAKAMSVAYRIALLQVLCIPTNEPDPDESTYERGTGPVLADPSTFEIGPEAQELKDKAIAAGTLTVLRRVWDSTKEAQAKQIISDAEFGWVKGVVNNRKAEMEAKANV